MPGQSNPTRLRLRKAEIALCLAVARFLIFAVPFRFYHRTLGPLGNHNLIEPQKLDEESFRQVRIIGRHILNIANRVPFKAVCLPQAMAGRWMLARRNIKSQIFIGVRKGEGIKPVDLHAWLMVDDYCVTGHAERRAFIALEGKGQASE